ncbi:MAG: hypothetical protein GF334_12750 [Candidatus Altiarchaeales archaeon]|nr:hypothetical protein [Candidatus Altiarchaeales archaeon]
MSEMNWPDEEVRKQIQEPKTLKSQLKEAGKIMLALADEVIILAVIGYVVYRLLSG